MTSIWSKCLICLRIYAINGDQLRSPVPIEMLDVRGVMISHGLCIGGSCSRAARRQMGAPA